MAAFALFAALQGVRRGVWPALIGVVAVLAAYLAASVWYRPLTAAIRGYLPFSESWAASVAFLLLLLVIVELVSLVLTMRTTPDNVPAPSRALGLAVGAVRGMALVTSLLVVALASPLSEPVQRDVDRSSIAPYAVSVFRESLRALSGLLPPTVQPFGIDDARF
jgi:uncharacterized membrane protein required for colicin V production